MIKILYLEDDVDYAFNLINTIGHDFEFTHITGVDELDQFKSIQQFDLILSDLYIGDYSHIKLLDKLDSFNTPIIIISSSDNKIDEFAVFSRNIEEYIFKSSLMNTIKLRIEKVVSNSNSTKLSFYSEGQEYFLVDESNVVVDKDGEITFLTLREYNILKYFVKHPNEIINRRDLYYCAFYKEISGSEQRVVDVYVTRLRKKLNIKQIKSVRGIGYTWNEKKE